MGFGRKIHIKGEAVTVSPFVLYISSRDGFPFCVYSAVISTGRQKALLKITAVRTAGRLKAAYGSVEVSLTSTLP